MNRVGQILLGVAAAGFVFNAHAVTTNEHYGTIVERNVFRLTAPPIVEPPKITNDVPEKNIELSGISTVNGQKKAWFIIKPKAGGKDAPQYVSLAEDMQFEFLKVLSISEKSGEVKVVSSGNSMTLSFEKNGAKALPGAVSVVPVPAPAIVAPVNNLPVGLGDPAVPQNGSINGGLSYPTRNGRGVTVTGGTQAPVAPGQVPNGLRQIPTRTVRLPSSANPPAEPVVDAVTQRALMEIQQAEAAHSGKQLPPLPPLPQ